MCVCVCMCVYVCVCVSMCVCHYSISLRVEAAPCIGALMCNGKRCFQVMIPFSSGEGWFCYPLSW